ncbi:diaminopimelate dehydrogenase [Alteribacillus iranensis]|uniref:Meso-diaminopimelate D-dehydrogenase n=1 Tax=Alteribacillus iranensis TaxID=930128 RepID=A0A1I2AG51_9BACI|nr:diaminopimelate dehydrogenase [Alteribacillus iranensis]SFE42941.1 diaminopimelate dehydrogenase [Alteribacillus iranensis]
MSEKIRIGITGYGNLGKGAQSAIKQNDDMELVAVFTRRDPSSLDVGDPNVKVISLDDAEQYKDEIDVMLLCGGSAHDLPEQGPMLARHFNTVDSFDTHAKVNEYFDAIDAPAKEGGNTGIISIGWDPGYFSLNRLYGEATLPEGETYTFWGKGLSQGHSDAVRRVEGVKTGVQYTIPLEDAVNRVRAGENPSLETKEKHFRECYVVPEEGADKDAIEREIKTMPNYFADYETTVNFIDEDEMRKNHSNMPHGGFVIRSGKTGENTNQIMEYSLKLDSNPEFTSSVLVTYARACHRLNKAGDVGAKSMFDVAPGLLSPKSPSQLRKDLL